MTSPPRDQDIGSQISADDTLRGPPKSVNLADPNGFHPMQEESKGLRAGPEDDEGTLEAIKNRSSLPKYGTVAGTHITTTHVSHVSHSQS